MKKFKCPSEKIIVRSDKMCFDSEHFYEDVCSLLDLKFLGFIKLNKYLPEMDFFKYPKYPKFK